MRLSQAEGATNLQAHEFALCDAIVVLRLRLRVNKGNKPKTVDFIYMSQYIFTYHKYPP